MDIKYIEALKKAHSSLCMMTIQGRDQAILLSTAILMIEKVLGEDVHEVSIPVSAE